MDTNYTNNEYLDYMLTEEDFSSRPAHQYRLQTTLKTEWNPASHKPRPYINEKVWVCGYLYSGIYEYTDGVYLGDGQYETKFDYMESVPEFRVLYWARIERVPEDAPNYPETDTI